METKLRSDEILAREAGESRNQIQRYVRLTELIPEILQMVDDGKVALRPAVELSYLKEGEQRELLNTMELELATPSHAQALKLKKFSQEERLNPDVIASILQEQKPNQKEHVKLPKEKIEKFFSAGTPVAVIEDTIVKALTLYKKRERSRAQER